MLEFDAIEKGIKSARQITQGLLNEEITNDDELQRIFKEWKVTEKVKKFEAILEKLEEKYKSIKVKIERSFIKLYFFGKMSSGKSTVINGIIGKDLFASGPDHTTNCFVHIKKSASPDYTIIHDGNSITFHKFEEARDKIEILSTNSEENEFEKDKFIEVFVPIDENNKIMKDNIELIDSPGSGNKEQITSCITEYATDADIFIFVSMNGLTDDDERFFEFQTENSARPDIFILINKWDETDCNRLERIKQSKRKILNKCDQLIMKMSENSDKCLRDRTYFISAKEIFEIRKDNGNEYLKNEKKKQRYEKFEKFELKLSEYIQHPKKHKYQRYSRELKAIKEGISSALQRFSENISSDIHYLIITIKDINDRYKKRIEELKGKCKEVESKCINELKCDVTNMMNTTKFDNSDEIEESIKKYYSSIDENIIKLHADLDEELCAIKKTFTKENNDGNDVENKNTSFSKLKENDFQINTDMETKIFKSKVALRVLCFIPIIGGIAANFLLNKVINNADEHDLNKESLKNINTQIHEKDNERIQSVKENIGTIEQHFIKEINEIIKENKLKKKRLKNLRANFNN